MLKGRLSRYKARKQPTLQTVWKGWLSVVKDSKKAVSKMKKELAKKEEKEKQMLARLQKPKLSKLALAIMDRAMPPSDYGRSDEDS